MRLTRRPRLSSRQPIDAAARPLPRLDTTPPVTKMYFADIGASPYFCWFGWRTGWADTSIAGTWGEGKGRSERVCQVWRARLTGCAEDHPADERTRPAEMPGR